MLAKFIEFVKAHIDNILLATAVALFVLFSFAAGYIIAKYQDRPPIEVIQP